MNSYDCVINTNIPEASSISYQKESFRENPNKDQRLAAK